MNRFQADLLALSAVFFWLLVIFALMVTGLFSAIGYSFGLIFLILGLISSAGCIDTVCRLWHTSQYWYLGVPLAAALITGTACAFQSVATMPSLVSPGDSAGMIIVNSGIVALLCLAPCAFLLFMSFLLVGMNNSRIKIAAGVSVIVSILSLAMLLDMALVAMKIAESAFFRHPLWECFMALYGLGAVVIGVLLILTVVRLQDGFPAAA